MINETDIVIMWIVAFVVITIVYSLCLCYIRHQNSDSVTINDYGKTYLKSITPVAPPMFNFTDSNNVLKKIVPVDKL